MIHFVRHAEGFHNEAVMSATHPNLGTAPGDPTPIDHTTPGAWGFIDAKLTPKGVRQCLAARAGTAAAPHCAPELVVVSPLTRTLQTVSGGGLHELATSCTRCPRRSWCLAVSAFLAAILRSSVACLALRCL